MESRRFEGVSVDGSVSDASLGDGSRSDLLAVQHCSDGYTRRPCVTGIISHTEEGVRLNILRGEVHKDWYQLT